MIVKDNYIVAIETTDSDFENLKALIDNKPTDPNGYAYKLRADTLEWELVELQPAEPEDDEATIEDAFNALNELGVDV